MLTTTSEYKTEISKTGRHFLNKIIINETEYTGIKNFSYHGGTNSSDHISIGDAVSAYIEFTLTDYPSKMLTGQIATAYIGLQLSDSVEWIKMGIFHLDKPKRNGNYLDITAYDNFSLMEKGFYSDLSGNQKIVDILNEQCNKIGISFVGGADDVYYNVDLLKGSSVREAVAILAAYCGKNAIINRDGNLKFVWFDDIGVTLTDDYYNDTIEFDEEDTVIKRLDCTNETETLSIGTGIGVVFSCPGMTQERLNVLYNRINGFTYRAVSFDWQRARPDIEAGDMINLTIQGNNCAVPLMDFIVSCDGGCYGSIESKGKTQEEQDHEFTSPSEARYNFVYEEVISVKKVMADTIDAWQGNFESIETNFLTVNQKITALEGEFGKINVDELTARIATIEQAYISKAEVEELYATKAEIGILDADVANIKTLLAGSTTTGDLQSIVINSKNAIIENGTIKNAMIESLAFDKITGVDINTTKLTVHSADGKSKWQDNTIQISDSTRVRVQIGKDASNDYNIYIWDKTGKLMFDATGVTADGIQRPIIRDDMVSDTANINGKKINIQSVVKEINNGTEKIKSSTVLYDPTGQTLNIAFNELITTVDGIDEKVESNTTQISVANGEINTLISKTTQMQTDLSSAQGNITDLSTKYNQMKQTVDSYGVTIGEHTSQITSVRNDLDNLEVGGRNLIRNSNFNSSTSLWIVGSDAKVQILNDSKLGTYAHFTSSVGYTGTNGARFYPDTNTNFHHETNVTYTLSFMAKSATGDVLHSGIGGNLNEGTYPLTKEWKRYTRTYTSYSTGSLSFFLREAGEFDITNIKIEKGNKPTDWTPAPEDIESSITEVSDKQSSMQLDLDGFKTSVSNTYATKTQLNTVDGKFANYSTTTQMNSAIQQSANSIKNEVSSTYVTKTDFNALEVGGRNLIIRNNEQVNKMVATDGSIGTLTGSSLMNDFIPVTPNEELMFSQEKIGSGDNYFRYCFYADDKKTVIRRTPNDSSKFKEIVPSGAYWLRVSYDTNNKVKIERGNKATDWTPAPEDIENSISSVNSKVATIETNLDSVTSRVSATETSITTVDGKVTNLTSRVTTAESKLTATSLITTISSGINGGTALTTTKFIMDKNGLHIKGGGLDISNNAGTKVLSSDTSGNLSITGAINATSGSFKGTISASTITGSTISGGTISGTAITGGTISSGTTINVNTNLTVGNNIYIGSYSDRNTQKSIYFNDRFYMTSRNDIVAFGLNNGDLFRGKVYINTSGGVTVRGVNAVNLVSDADVYIKASSSIDAESAGYLQLYSSGGGIKLQSGSKTLYFENSSTGIGSNTFRPAGDINGQVTLGNPNYLFYRLYAKVTEASSSDIRLKTNIKKYDERFEKMYMDLTPVTYQWKDEIGRSYCGLIAQWVKNSMDKYGITENEFGAYEHDPKNDYYAISYSQLSSLNMHMIQKTIMRVDTHDKEIAELKSEIARLQSKLEAYVNGTIEIKRA